MNDISHAIKLSPGQDLRDAIREYIDTHTIKAGWIVTCVGSLTNYSIRFANSRSGAAGSGYFEIVSLAGTLSCNGCHMHICIADGAGQTIGGHLLHGCTIYTTAEIIIAESVKYVFTRRKDGSTPWQELQIQEIKNWDDIHP